jgi:hypothetical protein
MYVYKLSGANAGTGVAATLRGQCITFQQVAAPGAVANMLPARDVHERISVMFVGPRAQLETQLGKALPFGANFSPARCGSDKRRPPSAGGIVVDIWERTRVEQQAHDFHVLGHLVHCMVQCCVAVRVSPVDAPLRTTIQEPTNASGVSFCRGVH